jgi:hypothetical protein
MVPLLGDDVARPWSATSGSTVPHRGAVRERTAASQGGGRHRDPGADGQRPLPWNSAFGDAAIDVGDPGGLVRLTVPDGPVVPSSRRPPSDSPPRGRWRQTLEGGDRPGRRDRGPTPSPLTGSRRCPSSGQCRRVRAQRQQHRPAAGAPGASVLLAADAFGSVLTAGLTALAQERGGRGGVSRDAIGAARTSARPSCGRTARLPRVDERRHLPPPRDEAIARIVVGPDGATVVQLPHPAHGRWTVHLRASTTTMRYTMTPAASSSPSRLGTDSFVPTGVDDLVRPSRNSSSRRLAQAGDDGR